MTQYTVTNIRYYDATYGAPPDESLRVNVSSFEELRQVEWMKRIEAAPGFSWWAQHFTRSGEIADRKLMAIFKDGAEWWVVANLPLDHDFGLPKWKGSE